MDDEQKLLPTNHHSQLRAEVSDLKELVGNLVSLISLNKVYPNNLEFGTCDEHVWKRACKDKLLLEKGAKQEDPSNKQQKLRQHLRQHEQEQQLRQQEQKQLPKGQLEQADLCSQQRLEQPACNSNIPKTTTTTNNNNMQHQQLRPDSLGTEARRPPPRPWRILVDTGAEISVAPRSFAAEIQLSPLQPSDLQLQTATGKKIETFGIRNLQPLCHGFSFGMSFVIADASQPLLGLGSLLRNNLSLHLDSHLGHYLGNNSGGKIQLEQLGRQIYLSACPVELGLSYFMMGNLLQHSLLPEAKKQMQQMSLDEGGAKPSLPLANPKQHRQPRNKKAIGQQTAFTQEAKKQKKKKKQKGQRAAGELRQMQQLRFIEKVQLDLLSPEHPKHSLDEAMAQDLSLRILLTISLM